MIFTRTWLALAASAFIALQAGAATAQKAGEAPVTPPENSRVEVYFTPDDNGLAAIVSSIIKAKRDIRIHAYLFTDRTIANALIRAHRRGVAVAVIVDQEKLEDNGVPRANELAAAGIPIYVDGQHAAAHNKIILIDMISDTPVVITGSYNFTVAAQAKNAENVLIIRGDRQLAAAYRKNWESHRRHSVRMQ